MSTPTPELLSQVRDLYEAGRFVSAHRVALTAGDPAKWTGTAARILGGRLLRHLGAPKSGERQMLRAYRWDPADPEARYFHLWRVADHRGFVEAWDRFRRFGMPEQCGRELYSDYCAFAGRMLSQMRDFVRADEWYARGRSGGTEHPWWAADWCEHLVRQDRYDEALEWGLAALGRHQGYWALEIQVAQVEMLTGRDEAGVQRLARAAKDGESGPCAMQWAMAAMELNRHEEALQAVDRVEALSPCAEEHLTRWMRCQRALLEYRLGRHDRAAEHARSVGDAEYWTPLAERLEKPDPAWRRVELPVPFTRQHHVTCVPATLTTLTRFWNRPADHLQVAEEICYDGTPSHSERHWAESNGWLAREFTLTFDSARALLDRGVPFCLTTVQPANAHEQAVIGYDDWRRSVLIRDPWFRNRYEMEAAAMLKDQAASGPRSMAMVPSDRSDLLEGVVLPESELYERLHACARALAVHDRPGALAAVESLEAMAPGHRLAWQGRRALASYDADTPAMLAVLDGLLALHPEDVNLQLGRLSCLRELGSREQRLEWLQGASARKGADALIWQALAAELSSDAREHAAARRWLRRSRRFRGTDAAAVHTWAGILWAEGEFDDAIEHYRLAACLADKREAFWESYFNAARARGRAEEALERLRERFERWGGSSADPCRTLVWALHELDRTAEASAVVARAVARRPADGEMALFQAEDAAQNNRLADADAALERARGRVAANAWRRVAARLAARRHESASALALWREILVQEPLAMDAHREVAGLLAGLEGTTAAKAHLRSAVERFPHHVPLRVLWIEWIRDETAAEREPVVQGLVAAEPADSWARRELALVLSSLGRHAEARSQAEFAVRLEPSNSSGHAILGGILREAGDLAAARECLRTALALAVDNTHAQDELLRCCGSLEERRRAIVFIRDELVRQTTSGNGLLHFLDLARPFLSAGELTRIAEDAHRARKDLWAAWLALARELKAAGRLWEAREMVRQAIERFPLVTRFSVELASIHRARMEADDELAALERVRLLAPAWGWAMRELADACLNRGEASRALEVLEQSVRHAPLDPYSWAWLGNVRHRLGQTEAAIAALSEAVRLEPGHEAAWDRLGELGSESGDPDLPVRLARELTTRRPAEARSWLVLARVLPRAETAERLEVIARGLELAPQSEGLRRQKVTVLLDAGRFDEAAAACEPPMPGGQVPSSLQALGAVVDARRGRRVEAINRMRLILDADPSLDWAWRELAGWLYEENRLDEALGAAQHLERLRPGDPVALGYSAAIRLQRGDKQAALELLRRAHELDAGYVWAGMKLFALQIDLKDLAGAARTLDRMRGQLPECRIVAGEIEIAFASLEQPPVRPLLERLLRSSGDEMEAFQHVAERLVQAGHGASAAEWTREILSAGGSLNPSAGAFLVMIQRSRGLPVDEAVLEALPEGTEVALRAWSAHLEMLGDNADGKWWWRRRKVRAQILRHEARYRGDTRLWGLAGYALVRHQDYAAASRWLAGGVGQPGVEPWMLLNLLVSHLHLGNEAQAREVLAAILAMPLRDHTYPRMRLWFALDAARAGMWAVVREAVAEFPDSVLRDEERALARWLGALSAWAVGEAQEIDEAAVVDLRAMMGSRTALPVLRSWARGAVLAATRTGAGWGTRFQARLWILFSH